MTEVVVALVLLGTVVVVLLSAVTTLVASSAKGEADTVTEAVLREVVDVVANAGYVRCPEAGPSAGTYETAAEAAAASYGWPPEAVSVESIRYWQPPSDGSSAANGTWAATNTMNPDESCSSGAVQAASVTLQEITVEVRNPDTGDTRSASVVKSVVALGAGS